MNRRRVFPGIDVGVARAWWIAASILVVLVFGFSGCRFHTDGASDATSVRVDVSAAPTTNILDGEVGRFDPAVDYFPEKTTFRHATQLRVEYHRHYKLVTFVSNSVRERLQYVLVQRGTPVPTAYPDARVFEVPARRLALPSWRYGGAADLLGVTDRLVAFRFKLATTPSILRLIHEGRLTEDFSGERMASLDPDVLMHYYVNDRAANEMNPYTGMGIRALPMAEHLEHTPLGQTEWIKFFAMFFNREAQAERLFAAAEAEYVSLAARVQGGVAMRARPKVALNAPFRGAWSVPGGRNVLARLIADAGGDYVFADDPSANSIRPMRAELAYDRSLEADVWLIDADSSGRRDLAYALWGSPLLGSVPTLERGDVWICNRPQTDAGNPYWDQALPKPHLLLADLVRILHPDLLPEHTLVFFSRLKPPPVRS